MQGSRLLEIWPHIACVSTGAQKPFHLSRLVPGDVIQARIISVSPEGRTRLQIGSSHVTANQSLGGKPGDILYFEVQPRLPTGELEGQGKSPLLIRMLAGSRRVDKRPSGGSSGKSGQLPTESSGRVAVAANSPPTVGGAQSNAQNPVLLALTATRLLGPIASHKAGTLDKCRRQIATSALRTKLLDHHPASQTSCGKRPEASTANRTQKDLREGTASSDYASAFLIEAAGEEYRSAYIRLHTQKAICSSDGRGDVMTASLMLDLDKTGPLEVAIQMAEDQIWVKFKVATEKVRKDIQARLGEMHTALKDLADKVYCRVQVDPEGGAMNSAAKRASQEKKEIDCTI